MAQTEHLPIYKAAYDLCLWLEQVVGGFPRFHEYAIGSDLRESARRILRLVVRANARTDKTQVWPVSSFAHLVDTTHVNSDTSIPREDLRSNGGDGCEMRHPKLKASLAMNGVSAYGGLATAGRLAAKLKLPQAIDRDIRLFKRHSPRELLSRLADPFQSRGPQGFDWKLWALA